MVRAVVPCNLGTDPENPFLCYPEYSSSGCWASQAATLRAMPRGTISLYVRGLTDRVSAQELREACEKYGEVRDVYVPRDYYTKRPRGFAYVEYPFTVIFCS